ncbi:hypothetical protein C8F01DRAFT_1105849 [Mycena amicta]|nr:hypothetical protein C8F01DRAFT_1105849 [Mycena amicta]
MPTYLDIPPEMWLHSFSYCSISDLCTLCLVNRRFASLCGAVRFHAIERRAARSEDVYGPGRGWKDAANKLESRISTLKELSKSPYAKVARSFLFDKDRRFSNYYPQDQVEYQRFASSSNHFETSIPSAISAFRGLKKLTLLNVVLDEPLRRAIESLEELEDLILWVLSLKHMICKPLPLKRLCMSFSLGKAHAIGDGKWVIVHPQTLQCLQLKTLPCLMTILSSLQSPRRLFPQLVRLQLPLATHTLAPLYQLLPLCPNLENLELWPTGHDFYYPQDLPALPLAVVPRLRAITIPLTLVGDFVRGRPVDTVHISGSTAKLPSWLDILAIIDTLSQSTVPIRKLVIDDYNLPPRESEQFFTQITGHLPQLRLLSVGLEQNEMDAYGCIKTIAPGRVPWWKAVDAQCISEDAVEVGLPDEEKRGYRYDPFGGKFPPPTESFALVATRDNPPIKIFMNLLLATRFPLPHHLHTLRFNRRIWSFFEEHATILALEEILPELRELEFRDHGHTAKWTRDRNVWSSLSMHRATGHTKVKVVSQVWKADGSRWDAAHDNGLL